jgi:hypothetical protein
MKPPSTNTPPLPMRSSRPGLDRPPTAEERRRAQRVLLRMGVKIHVAGKSSHSGHTHTVSASGAMVVLAEPLSEGTAVTIENLKTQTQIEARVVRPPTMTAEGWLVPMQFLTASPKFWNVFFPPAVN